MNDEKGKTSLLEQSKTMPLDELFVLVKELKRRMNETLQAADSQLPRNAKAEQKNVATQLSSVLETAIERAETENISAARRKAYLKDSLQMLSSCYRYINSSEKCILLKDRYENDPSDVLDHEFYTSLAAAYCDLEDPDSATDYLEKATAMNHGTQTRHIHNVYLRIQALKARDMSLDDILSMSVDEFWASRK